MKKLLYLFAFLAFFLTGCEKKSTSIPAESLFLMENNTTHDGIKSGDGFSEFRKAYGDYTIQVGYDEPDSVLRIMEIDDIPYEDEIFTIIASFFIDGKPVSEEDICTKNRVEPSALYDLLSSDEFLRGHDVIYRYLIFSWKGGVIEDIASKELNYNETFDVPRAD